MNNTHILSVASVIVLWVVAEPPASAQWRQVSGNLVQISAGAVEVWGLNASQQVYRFNPSTGVFDQMPGRLAQIAVGGGYFNGPTDGVWGVNASQQVYRFNPVTQLFDQVPGNLMQIAVGGGGVWGVNASQQIYRFNFVSGHFDQIPGSLARIDVGADSVYPCVWGINGSHQVFRFNPSNDRFDQIQGSLAQIAVGATTVWGISTSQQIFRFDRSSNLFEQVPGSLAQIAVGAPGVWGISASEGIYKFKLLTGAFEQLPGSLIQIAAGGAGIFGINALGQIFQLPWADPIAIAQPAKLLVVAPAEFQTALQPLIDHKNQTGMPTLMVTTESLYDSFDGIDGAERIKRGIYEAYWRLGIHYVLLAGDAQKLPVRYYYVAQPPGASITPYGGWMDGGYPASDLYYANLQRSAVDFRFETWDANENGKYNETTWTQSPYDVNPDSVDGYPWVAVGRIPANNPADIQTYVNKVIRYETGQMAPHYEVTFLNDRNYDSTATLSSAVIQNSAISNVSRLNLVGVNYGNMPTPDPEWTNGNIATIDNAMYRSWWVSYIGHGYSLGWAISENDPCGTGECVNNYDAGHISSALINAYNLPIVFAAACETGDLAPVPPTGEYMAQNGKSHWFWYYDIVKTVLDRDTGQIWDFRNPATSPIAIPPPAEFDFLSGDYRTFAYSWLFNPQGGGAIAYFGENATMPDQAGADLEGFVLGDYVIGQRVLGQMFLDGQRSYWRKYQQASVDPNQTAPRIYLGTMELFGDPSLRLK